MNTSPEQRYEMSYLLTFVFYLLVMISVAVWLYPLIRQLNRLRKTAKHFGEGDLTQRIKLGKYSYIADIEEEFNHMATRIESLMSDVKLLSSAVSHDLRTPLARIRFGIDTLEEEEDPKQQKLYINKISRNVDEMTSLVESLLKYARLDQSFVEINKSRCDLSELVGEVIATYHANTDLLIESALHKNSWVHADQQFISMLVNNLLSNACRYAQTQILVSVVKQDSYFAIIVEDDGKGFDLSEAHNLLKPFVRSKIDIQNQKGHGLGLAIVKRISDWHDAKISISKSKILAGACVQVLFSSED
jgi:two-component system, OmpR family, sensor kinase